MISDTIRTMIQGFLVGTANVIPGVSGGTVALVLGIYDRLIRILSALGPKAVFVTIQEIRSLGLVAASRNFYQRFDLKFLIPLGIGAVFAVISVAALISFLISNYREQSYGFFAGLVLASLYFPAKLIKKFGNLEMALFLFAVGLMLIVMLIPIMEYGLHGEEAFLQSQGMVTTGLHRYLTFFVGGIVSFSAMILPGISGSFVLLVSGLYFDLLKAIAEFDFFVLFSLGAGGVVGLLTLSRIIKYFLDRFFNPTMSFLGGLIFGSLLNLWPFQVLLKITETKSIVVGYTWPREDPYLLISTVICFSLGSAVVALSLFFEKKTDAQNL